VRQDTEDEAGSQGFSVERLQGIGLKSPTKNDNFKPLQEDSKSPRRNRRNQQRGSPEVSDSKIFPISINLPIVGNLAEQP
jgi:hypothetical protein